MMTATIATSDLEWVVRPSAPPGWPEAIQVCGGGFFHSPLGLLTGAPPGDPVFIDLWHGNTLSGIAVGVRHGCRLSARRPHAYFPTLPAIRDPHLRERGLVALHEAMRDDGVDDIVVDSFDASWTARSGVAGRETVQRTEYIVPLEGVYRDELPSMFSGNHRRHCLKGARRGWTVRALRGAEDVALMAEVQGAATERAEARGDGFEVEPIPACAFERQSDDNAWGMTAFGAWDDAGALLTAAAIGWANGRTYYVSGGSTPKGYAQGSAPWLHWQIMKHFAGRGFTTYNLGGTPASAGIEGDPSFGLQRFKMGFGATALPLRSLKWELETVHVFGHRVKNWASERYDEWNR
jgi:hypothetical protein